MSPHSRRVFLNLLNTGASELGNGCAYPGHALSNISLQVIWAWPQAAPIKLVSLEYSEEAELVQTRRLLNKAAAYACPCLHKNMPRHLFGVTYKFPAPCS